MIALCRRVPLRAPADVVRERVRSTVELGRCFTGLTLQDLGGGEVRVASALPRPFEVTLQVVPDAAGVGFRLVRGALMRAEGHLRVEAETLEMELVLESPVLVPPSLLLELTERVVPGWLGALVANES